jgi:hypothetical protein
MDQLLGSIIGDYTLYKIFEGIMVILSLVIIYLGIQIALTWKFIKKEEADSNGNISEKMDFYRSSIFIFITGFFMLLHEFLEGLDKDAPDFATYELLELIALSGLVLFLYELNKTMKKSRKKLLDPLLSRFP